MASEAVGVVTEFASKLEPAPLFMKIREVMAEAFLKSSVLKLLDKKTNKNPNICLVYSSNNFLDLIVE